MTFDPTALDVRVAVESSDAWGGEEGGADIADQTTNAVDGKDIECIVNSKEELNLGSIVRASSADSTKDDSRPWGDIA